MPYNVYVSDLQEGVYTKIAENITEPSINIESPDTAKGGEKFIKVAEVNNAGEGFLSKPVKLTFIGDVPKPEILQYFYNGFFIQYKNAAYATEMNLQASINGGEFKTVDTSTLNNNGVMIYNGSQNISVQVKCSTENSQRTGGGLKLGIPQNFNLCTSNAGILTYSLYRITNSGNNIDRIDMRSGNPSQACYLGNNTVLFYSDRETLRSTDGGITWAQMGSGQRVTSLCYLGNGTVIEYSYSMSAYPSLNYITRGIARSIDGGLTWSQVKTFPTIYDPNYRSSSAAALAYLGNNTVILADSLGDSCMSFDAGISWNQPILTGKSVSSFWYIGQNRLWASIRGEGLWYSDNGGYNWSRPFTYLNSVSSVCYQGGSSILVGAGDQGIWGVSSAGKDYAQYFSGPSVYKIVHAGSSTYIASASDGLYRSLDNGRNWNKISTISGNILL